MTQNDGAESTGSTCPAPFIANDDRGWLDREPTQDERDVVKWLERRNIPERILHVGVGNSLLRRHFGEKVRQGITKDGMEAIEARSTGLNVITCNKYDVESYRSLLITPFDCCVDVNIRSYACCDVHFQEYMSLVFESLVPGGILVTAISGLEYLVPTSLGDLRRMFPHLTVRARGNVVVIRQKTIRRMIDRLASLNLTKFAAKRGNGFSA